jgi:hypothetical protein
MTRSTNHGQKRRRSASSSSPRRPPRRPSLFAESSPTLCVETKRPSDVVVPETVAEPIASVPAAAAAAIDQKKRDFLHRLSQACLQHKAKEHAHHDTTSSSTTTSNSSTCEAEMQAVQRLMPRMHQFFANDAAAMPHICDFYIQGLHGSFCPLAPRILFEGPEGMCLKVVHTRIELSIAHTLSLSLVACRLFAAPLGY